MPDRPWQSRGQFSLPLWCYSAVRSLERGDRPHVIICSFGVVNRAVTSNATLRPAGADRARGVPSVTGQAVEKSPDNATGVVADDR